MRDPFEQLRDPVTPAAPDPAFTAGLRDRLAQALGLPRGVVPMTGTEMETEMETQMETQMETKTQTETDAGGTAQPRPGALPYLAVADARAALDWYEEVFGATVVGDPFVMDDGRIGHAEIAVGGGVLYLADEFPELGLVGPREGQVSVTLLLAVADADEVHRRAVAAGASGDREPYDGYGRRNAPIIDPFGHRWSLNSPPRG